MVRRQRNSRRSPWILIGEMAWAAPQVVAYRAVRVLRGGLAPDARDRRELRRMGQEKVEGLVEAVIGAVRAAPHGPRAMLGGAVRPVHRRVLANRRRLSRG